MVFTQNQYVSFFWISTGIPYKITILYSVYLICFSIRGIRIFFRHLIMIQNIMNDFSYKGCISNHFLSSPKEHLFIILQMNTLKHIGFIFLKFKYCRIIKPNIFYLGNYIYKMPPKKSQQKTQVTQDKSKTEGTEVKVKVQKQTKLFESKEQDEQAKNPKSRSKKFNESSTQKTQNHTNLWQYGNGKTPNKLLISSWNVNGIRSVLNKKELTNYLDKVKPDILCINESKIDYQAYKKDPIKITGYHGYWNFCKCSAGYSGVAIFSKYLPLAVTEDLPQKEHSQQGRVITIEFQQFYLITAYIPNSGQKLDRLKYRVEQYDKCFQQYCNDLKKKKSVIICGDLNVCHKEIDIARPKGNQKTAGFTVQERNSFTKFLQTGWVDTFRKFYPTTVKYSWWSMRTGGRAKNIGWRLDYFLMDQKSVGKVKDSTINNDIYGSDHCPIELVLQLK